MQIHYTIGIRLLLRADDWIRTSMSLFTRQEPFSVEPRRPSTSARSRTPSVSFGDRLLSQEHTRLRAFYVGRLARSVSVSSFQIPYNVSLFCGPNQSSVLPYL